MPVAVMSSVPVVPTSDCCFLLCFLQHNKAAVQVKEDMKKMVQLPILRPRAAAAKEGKLFGVSLLELRELGLLEDGVPVVVRRMVEYLRKHGEGTHSRADCLITAPSNHFYLYEDPLVALCRHI